MVWTSTTTVVKHYTNCAYSTGTGKITDSSYSLHMYLNLQKICIPLTVQLLAIFTSNVHRSFLHAGTDNYYNGSGMLCPWCCRPPRSWSRGLQKFQYVSMSNVLNIVHPYCSYWSARVSNYFGHAVGFVISLSFQHYFCITMYLVPPWNSIPCIYIDTHTHTFYHSIWTL